MGRDKKWFGIDTRRGYFYGRFYGNASKKTLKIKLISQQELEFKETKRGVVRRSEREQLALLQVLHAEKQKELDNKKQAELDQGDVLANLFKQWLQSVADLREVKTLNHYQDAVRHFFTVNPPKLRTSELGSEHFLKLARYLGKKFSETTANSYLRDLRAGITWLHDQKFISEQPKITFFRTTKKDPGVFTSEELEAMHYHLKVKLEEPGRFRRKWILMMRTFMVLRWSGMRGSELLWLQWKDVDLETRKISLKEKSDGSTQDHDEDGFRIKNRKEESIPIADPLHVFLWNQKFSGETWVLDDGKGNRYWKHLNELTSAMRKFQRSLGIKDVKPLHGFRATLATQLTDMDNANIYHVQQLLRHASITTTMGYVNKQHQEISNLVNQLNEKPTRATLKLVNGSKND
jgi:integrase